MLRTSWAYPGPASARRAFYRSARRDGDYEPIQPHQVPAGLRRTTPPDSLTFPRTGLPRDPYALRPRHLDTARGILDAAIEALDRRMGGAITKGQRHRREPVRVVHPPSEHCYFFGPSTRALRVSSGLATKFHAPSSFQGPRSSLPIPISPSPSRDRL